MKHPTKNYNEYFDVYLEEAEIEEDIDVKNIVFKPNSFMYKEKLQDPKIAPVLAKEKNREALIDFTGKFLDDHSEALYAPGPIHMFTFSTAETDVLYNMFNTSREEVEGFFKESITEVYFGKLSAPVYGLMNKVPHKILITSILLEAIQKGYSDIVTVCTYLWGFAEYPLIFRKFWKTGVDESIMRYTIEHLKNKFKIKNRRLDNLLMQLYYDMNLVITQKTPRLKVGTDEIYIDLSYSIRNQIKNTFKNLSREYYKNHEANATQHAKSAKTDDGQNAEIQGHTSNIASTTESTYSKVITAGVDSRRAAVTAEKQAVNHNILIGYLELIYSSKNSRMYKFIENMITSFLTKNPTATDVGSTEFLSYGLALYRRIATSKDPLYREIRSILDLWMFDIIDIKKSYQRAGTIINYTRAIFDYMVMTIHFHNKN